MPEPAVFFDRDGTIIEDMGYPSRPEQIRLIPGAAKGLQRLAQAGFRLIVVTNQSGLARGILDEDDLARFHDALDRQLASLGAHVDAYYTCPHYPDPVRAVRRDLAVECGCRKPKPGMILQAADDLHIDLEASWMVGDTWRDIQAGQAAGVRTIKLPAGPAHDSPRPDSAEPPDFEASDFDSAAQTIINHTPDPQPPPEPEPEPEPEPVPAPEPKPAPPPEPEPEPVPAPEPKPAPPPEPEPEPVPAPEPKPAPPPEPEPEPKPEPEPAPAPEPSPDPTPVCARCAQPIANDDLHTGKAVRRDGLLLCPDCATALPRRTRDLPESAPGLLRAILLELRRSGRRHETGTLSAIRLFAYVIQAAAVFCALAPALLSEAGPEFLQVAVFLQLWVATLLLMERKP